ncbi:filamin-A-like isoform X3 [Oratosquilla oratoria]|uniref:filamin-A-like isoform X3 n=1 Tax=Oratosquilla oratoria TaxID=337810 RepID=UPI003F7781F6
MEIAKKEFNIPMLLEPEYLASPYLDDLSGMTYLSYFMKEGAPGYKATLEWVQKTLPDKNITNFTSDWNDGTNLASLVKKLGGPVPGYKNLSKERPHWESNLQLGIDGGRRLGVEPVLSASDMARTDVEHLGVMGYIAYYQWLRPRKSPGERLAVKCDLDNVRVNNPVPFRIDFLTKDVVLSEVTVQVTGPSGPVRVDLDLGPRGGSGVFVPEEVGMYELNVLNEDEPVDGSPFKVRALPNISKIMFSGIDPCALGSIVEVLINSNGAGGGGIDVIAHSPTNRQLECPVKEEDGVYAATFQPDEAGEWSIAVAYDDEHIQGSPFTCHVYDPHALKVRNLDKGPTSEPGKPFTVLVDASGCGWGEAKIDITHGGRSVPSKVLEIERGIYEVTFTPLEAGKHKVYTYFNGHEVKGSPHSLYLGVEKPPERKDSKSKKKKSKENREAKVKEKVKEYSSTDLINNSPRHNSSSNYDSSSKFTSSINKSFESSINKTSGYDTRDSPSRDSNRISYESSPSPPSKLRSSIVDSNYRNDSYDSSYKKTSKYESSSSILKSSIVDSTYDRSPSSTPIKYEPALQKSSALDTSLNRSSNYDSSFNSTFNTSLNSSTSTVINSTSNVNKSSSVFKTSSTALNSSSSSSTSRLASPRSPPPPPIKPSTDRRSVSPPAQVPDSMSNLSSPAKVLQIAQNSAKNSEAWRYRNNKLNTTNSTTTTTTTTKHGTRLASAASTDEGSEVGEESLRVSSEQAAGLLRSEEHQQRHHQMNMSSNIVTSNITTTIKRLEESHLSDSTEHLVVSGTPSGSLERIRGSSPYDRPPASSPSPTQGRHLDDSPRGIITTTAISHGQEREDRGWVRHRGDGDSYLTHRDINRHDTRDAIKDMNKSTYRDKQQRDMYEASYRGDKQQKDQYESTYSSSHRDTTYRDVHKDVQENFYRDTQESKYREVYRDSRSLPKSKSGPSSTTTTIVKDTNITKVLKDDHPTYKETYVHSKDTYRDKYTNRDTHTNRDKHISKNKHTNRKMYSSREDLLDRDAYMERDMYTERDTYIERDEYAEEKDTYTERDTYANRDTYKSKDKHTNKDTYISRDSPSPREVATQGQGQHKERQTQRERYSYSIYTPHIDHVESYSSSREPKVKIHKVHREVVTSSSYSPPHDSHGSHSALYNSETYSSDTYTPQRREHVTYTTHVDSDTEDAYVTSTSVDVTDAVNHRFQSNVHTTTSTAGTTSTASGNRVDASRVNVSGPGVRLVPVASDAFFSIEAPYHLRQEDVVVTITGPGKRGVGSSVMPGDDGELIVSFKPTMVGEYLVDVLAGHDRVPGSPFRCYVYDSQEIRVGRIPNGVVGRPVEFEIDGSSAGSGNLEILVNGGHVTSHVRNLGQQRFLASFVPHSAIRHTVEMRFNGEKVPGSPWSVEVMEGSSARVAVLGDSIKHFPAGQLSAFDVSAANVSKEDIQVHIVSPAKRPVSYQLTESGEGVYRVAFATSEVGSYVVDVGVSGQKVQGSPFIAKAYDAALIRVSDVPNGVVGQPCQFRVDASQAGEGQLEISINDGEVPNHVQVLGGGRCLVSFTPDTAKIHTIDIKFNGETVRGCPFVCRVADTSRVSLTLRHLELIPVDRPAAFNIAVDGGGSAELTVTVRTPSHTTLPVRVSGSVRAGFTAEFTPLEVGAHTIIVNYNDSAVSGTPFTCKVYDASKVGVSHLPRGAIGKSLQFIVDASEAGEGNLEISISAAGRNIPTQVHPQGSARFAVSFVPLEAIDHVINISFNKEPVTASPFIASVQADQNRIVVSGQSLAASAVGKTSFFTISNVTGSVEDVEVSVEGPSGLPVAAQVRDNGDNTFRVEFAPRSAGEHRIHVAYNREAIAGSPFSCKVYDVAAIKVRPAARGMVGKPVTFLVETNNAGPGNLEVTVNNGQVPTSAQAQGNHVYAISFTPKEAKSHVVELKFNGENVPGSPFSCDVVDVSMVTVAGAGLEKVPVDKTASFTVDTQQAGLDQLTVVLLSPSRHAITPHITQAPDGKLLVEYTPVEVGDHSADVRVAGMPVPGSPFLVKAYDSAKVKVTEVTNGVVAKPVYFSIDASQAGAGNLEIIVSVNGRNVPNYVQSEGHARFRVNFKPKEAAVHTLSVKFNGEPVPGSPFKCRVSDSSQVVISGAALKMSSLARPAIFTIDPRCADIGDCVVNVTSPAGARVPVNLEGTLPNKLTAEFQPVDVGPHTINVIMDGDNVGGSPFTCNIYDVTKVQVTGLDNTKVGRPVTFTVDASQAGEGTLELVVTTAKASVRAEVAARSRGLYDVTFTPHEPIPHFVNITFNEEDVEGSPFKCEVRELEPREVRHLQRKESQMVTAKGDGLKQVVTGSTAAFTVDTKGLDGDLDIRVTGPDGGQIPARLVKLRNSLHRAEYRAEQVGSYSVAVLHQGSPINGTPYVVEAADPRRVAVQTGAECFSGRECSLSVDASGAGRGSLSVGVRAAGQDVKHSIRDLGAGHYQVLFYPRAPIPHKVDVRYNAVPVKGGPFEINVRNPATGHAVTATGLGLHQARVNKATSFVIETLLNPSKDFDVIITGPGDWAVPVKCYQQKDGNLLAEYMPHIPGTYKIEVLCDGKNVKGSPFGCTAYDASQVILETNKTTAAVGEPVIFKLDKSAAGVADVEAHVEAPSGVVVPLEVKNGSSGTTDAIEWTPEASGQYRVTLLYGGEEVPGSPVFVEVGESGLAGVSGPGLVGGGVNTPLNFTIDGRGLVGEPHVTVDGPDSVAKVNVRKQEEGLYQVTYFPHEVGIFDVRVQWNKRDVAGSPFHPKVVDPCKVRLIGGWESLKDSHGRLELIPREEKRLAFDLSEAGPGRLRGELHHEGEQLDFGLDQSGSRAKVFFSPTAEGEYELQLWYGDLLLPDMPIIGWAAAPSTGDHTRVTLRGHGLTTARCGEEAEFVIDGSEAGPGCPDVTMAGTKNDIMVTLTPEDQGVWRATYTPNVAGVYLLNVMWADRQVRGCPLKVAVDSVADASKVVCTGDGLRHGMVGKEIKSFIDTRRAGPGELTARCVGPHKVAVCELYDHRDGTFTLNVKPQESGRHHLSVMYETEHVPGSPFALKVAGAPDPSKVRVYGPGIEHGVLAAYKSKFICDTHGAGAGQLTVRIRGPKGAFRVEMQRESQKDRTILCKFDPTEPGDYRIEVKWSGEHVPGSPFMVMIFDTEEELNRYVTGGYSPNSPGGAPSEYYGSIGYGTTYGAVSFGQMSWRGSQAQL